MRPGSQTKQDPPSLAVGQQLDESSAEGRTHSAVQGLVLLLRVRPLAALHLPGCPRPARLRMVPRRRSASALRFCRIALLAESA
jgi:hypothetical protein